jgi:CHRD domain
MNQRNTVGRKLSRVVCAGVVALGAVAFTSISEASVINFKAVLSGGAEAPPNGSAATGTAEVTIDDVLLTMRVQADFSGLLANVTIAHLHCCTAIAGAGTAGVAAGIPSFAGFPAGATSGSYDRTFDLSVASSYNPPFIVANGGTISAAFASLLAGLKGGSAYFNVHKTEFAAGEIRGFLTAQSSSVPLPASIATLLMALGSLLGLSRFKVKAS